MIKRRKFFILLIFSLMCAILPFIGVAKVKAAISDISQLKNTIWVLNDSLVLPDSDIKLSVNEENTSYNVSYATYEFGDFVFPLGINTTTQKTLIHIEIYSSIQFITLYQATDGSPIQRNLYQNGQGYRTEINNLNYGSLPRRLTFGNYEFSQTGDFLGWLQANATQETEEPTTRTIPFFITFIRSELTSTKIDLPVYDDTVSFTVSFQPNKMISGTINHPESADELGELTFPNGERVFYTIYYNETNIDFKMYYYGEQLELFEAVVYNTPVYDDDGNFDGVVATYWEGISEQEMDTLKNSGIYEASFNITIPPENELNEVAALGLEIMINESSTPPENEDISNIMTGIFTLISSFLSIQLGFITLGQIIGLVLAVGVIFFIFYVWNGGRNGN